MMKLPPLEIFKLDSGAQQVLLETINDDKYVEPLKRIKAIFDSETPEKFAVLPWQGDELGRLIFAAAVLDYFEAVERFNKLGWSIEYLNEALADIGIWTRHRKRNLGDWGVDCRVAPFIRCLYRGTVTRAGRLQFNTSFIYSGAPLRNDTGDILLLNGDPAINIHIPEDGPLTPEACRNSFDRISDFYHKYRSNVEWRGFVCHAWFLDPKLQELLPPDSNIIKFQKMGYLNPLAEKSDVISRVFGVRAQREGVTAVEWKTSLQKILGPYLRDGGEIHPAWIFIPR